MPRVRLCVPASTGRFGCNNFAATPIPAYLNSTSVSISTSATAAVVTRPFAHPIDHSRTNTNTLTASLSTTATPPSTSSVVSTLATMTNVEPGHLGNFLLSQNEQLLQDLKAGRGKGWIVSNGNEAGDLDSIASSVAYAFLSSTLDAERTVPLVLTPKKLMSLRPENLLALQRANIPLSALLHPEDLPAGTEALTPAGVRFALVDHNHLLPAFAADPESVAAIIDHHEDEGVSPHANPRLIRTPLGSCASLVTKHFMPLWKASLSGPAGQAGSPVPPELATLLLSAILIDTSGLKKGGKAVDIDYAAAEFLYPISTLVNSTTSLVAPTTPEAIAAVPELEAYASTLSEIKHNVTGMSTPNLLQRDYKQYEWATASSAFPTLHVGLSTVPLSLRNQLEAEPTGWESYLAHVDAFMHERGIDIEGVLTSYRSEKKNKGRREFLLLVRSDSALPPDAAARALAALSAGLEAEVETFKYSPWGTGKSGSKGDLAAAAPKFLATPNRIGAVWDQGNAQSTRKQVAPVLMHLVSQLS